MTQSDSLKELATALCKAQAEMPSADKDGVNPHFRSKFATLANVMQTALPTLTKHGLSVTQFVSNLDGQSAMTTILMHTSGEYISATMPLLLTKNDPQGQGSAISYARRYGLMSAIGMVADEDDDGNAASHAPRQATAPEPATFVQKKKIKELLGAKITAFEQAKGIKVDDLTKSQASQLIDTLEAKQAKPTVQVEGEAMSLDEMPF